jgi:hypothetical protein
MTLFKVPEDRSSFSWGGRDRLPIPMEAVIQLILDTTRKLHHERRTANDLAKAEHYESLKDEIIANLRENFRNIQVGESKPPLQNSWGNWNEPVGELANRLDKIITAWETLYQFCKDGLYVQTQRKMESLTPFGGWRQKGDCVSHGPAVSQSLKATLDEIEKHAKEICFLKDCMLHKAEPLDSMMGDDSGL